MHRPNDIITQLVANTKAEQNSEMQANKWDNLHTSTAKTAITEIKQMTIVPSRSNAEVTQWDN